ncbi:hypothetical protein CLCR_01362 [Cladophialophora carrionii]|uniref:Uncharacterized protein n=1 Tax=Cladophialophora carrionii TaxID=86049 RepID=A0A1C1CCR3_9EURO|nr:hypothetical protein CLCR_01362 [Cladophialophora carrionii]
MLVRSEAALAAEATENAELSVRTSPAAPVTFPQGQFSDPYTTRIRMRHLSQCTEVTGPISSSTLVSMALAVWNENQISDD